MRIMFVLPAHFVSEPLGVMLLKAICNKAGHVTRLHMLTQGNLSRSTAAWNPDVIAYSAMTPGIETVIEADRELCSSMNSAGRRIFRVMGGPHPTFSPGILDVMKLDAICQGDGDAALPTLLSRLERGMSLEGIPNIGLTGAGAVKKELFSSLDDIPFADREEYYQYLPEYRKIGLRSFWTSRGCPYDCSYCFNHAYNQIFKGCGKLFRRRSVNRVLAEIEYVKEKYSPVRFIRFADDTFAHTADEWLEEFSAKYTKRIGIPFYCLMRSNTLTDETAGLLKKAGCHAIGMSLEAGSEHVRNQILNRNLTNEVVEGSLETAKRHRLNVYTNTMFGIPGTTMADDIESLEFTRKMKPGASSFTICCPFPGTRIWEFAKEKNLIDENAPKAENYMALSTLNCYTLEEKKRQGRMCYLAPLYCGLPFFMKPLIRQLIRLNTPLALCNALGMLYFQYRMLTRIMPYAIPRTPWGLIRFAKAWVGFLSPGRKKDDAKRSEVAGSRNLTLGEEKAQVSVSR